MSKSIRTECKNLSDEELYQKYKNSYSTDYDLFWLDKSKAEEIATELGTSPYILEKIIRLESRGSKKHSQFSGINVEALMAVGVILVLLSSVVYSIGL